MERLTAHPGLDPLEGVPDGVQLGDAFGGGPNAPTSLAERERARGRLAALNGLRHRRPGNQVPSSVVPPAHRPSVRPRRRDVGRRDLVADVLEDSGVRDHVWWANRGGSVVAMCAEPYGHVTAGGLRQLDADLGALPYSLGVAVPPHPLASPYFPGATLLAVVACRWVLLEWRWLHEQSSVEDMIRLVNGTGR